MPIDPNEADHPPDRKGAIEWLYISFFGGGLVLLLLIVVLAFFTTGKLTQQAERVADLNERVAALESTVAQLAKPATGKSPPPNQPQRGGPAPDTRGAQSRPTTRPASDPRPTTNAAVDVNDDMVQTGLRQIVAEGPRGVPEVRDSVAAAALLDRVAPAPASALMGSTWENLAVLARLRGDDERAAQLAARAESAGKSLERFEEISIRYFLANSRPAEATILARALARRPGHEQTAAALLAFTAAAQRNLPEARRAVRSFTDIKQLKPYDRLLAGRVFELLERWDDLGRALTDLGELADPLAYERDYLRAVHAISAGQFAEAVAILDFLIDQRPEDYDAMTWRGVALMRARQPDAALQTLARASRLSSGRPEAWYWLGILDLNQAKSESGRQYLHNALAASSRFGPAWEALAGESLNSGDLAAAQDQIHRAIAADPERASSYFLLALCHAKASRQDDAAEALRKAVAIDRTLLDRAMKTELLSHLLDDASSLAPPPDATTQPSEG